MLSLPSHFVKTTIDVHGPAGVVWLQRLPELLTECAERWKITIDPPFTPLTYNYVAPAVHADGTPVILKLGVPSRELTTEIHALRVVDGRGGVRLLDADAGQGILLLERLLPGTSLLSVTDDEQAVKIAACVMEKFWRPAPSTQSLPTVAEWFLGLARLRQKFDGGTGPLPRRLVEQAELLSAELVSSAANMVLLHGDLHHGNILRAGRAPWLAIDPKGVVGEPAFEPSAFLLNPTPQSADVLQRRVAIFTEVLDLPRERVRGWGIVRAMLSACWTLEDHGTDWEGALAVAERLTV